MFLASGPGSSVYRSEDLDFWEVDTLPFTITTAQFITKLNDVYMIIGSTGSGTQQAVSTDGVSWTEYTDMPHSTIVGVAYGDGKYLAWTNDSRRYTSTDMVNWTEQTPSGLPGLASYNPVYFNGQFHSVSYSDAYRSSDGSTWQTTPLALSSPSGIILAGDSIVATGKDLSGNYTRIAQSSDGVNWTDWRALDDSANNLSNTLAVDVYGDDKAVGKLNGRFYHSNDLVSWRRDERPTDWTHVNGIYAQGQFIYGGNTDTLLVSDGVGDFTLVNVQPSSFRAEVFGYFDSSSQVSGISLYNGSEYVDAPLRFYNGSEWVDTQIKRWTGSDWE